MFPKHMDVHTHLIPPFWADELKPMAEIPDRFGYLATLAMARHHGTQSGELALFIDVTFFFVGLGARWSMLL